MVDQQHKMLTELRFFPPDWWIGRQAPDEGKGGADALSPCA